MGKHEKQDKEKKKKKKKREYHTVIEELDGTLVCSCCEFNATAKTCLQISAARLYRDFGPPERYSNPEKKKESGNRNKRQKKDHPGGTLKKEKGPRPPADHHIDDEHESFLEALEEADYNPFPTADKSVNQPPGTIVSSGRPAGITAHQPGRSPTKFSKKPGPSKGNGYNSLLPSLSNKSPRKSPVKIVGQLGSESSSEDSSDSQSNKPKSVLPIPPKDKGKAKAAPEPQGPAVTAEDLDILDIDFKRWDDQAYSR